MNPLGIFGFTYFFGPYDWVGPTDVKTPALIGFLLLVTACILIGYAVVNRRS
jgi:hypothetical protein